MQYEIYTWYVKQVRALRYCFLVCVYVIMRSCFTAICECENGAACLLKHGKPYCNCRQWYTGERCEHGKEQSCQRYISI